MHNIDPNSKNMNNLTLKNGTKKKFRQSKSQEELKKMNTRNNHW